MMSQSRNRILQNALLACVISTMPMALPTQADETPNPPRYEPEFLWGSALSAHQNEGMHGGGENGDWYVFEHTPGNTVNGDTADIATDHWHRYLEDFAHAKAMGLGTVRTSIAWEKFNPAPGVFSTEVIAHYRRYLMAMRAFGLRPLITLRHGVSPIWFQQKGGWLNDDSPRMFLEYAERVVTEFKDLCDLWITFNEPMILVGLGYLEGDIPPQESSFFKAFHAGRNIVRAHRATVAMIHSIQPVGDQSKPVAGQPLRGVGTSNGFDIYDPLTAWNPLDRYYRRLVDEGSNWMLAKAMVYGKLKMKRPPGYKSRPAERDDNGEPEKDEYEADLTSDPLVQRYWGSPQLDWIGVNHYTRTLIGFTWGRPKFVTPEGPVGDNGWAIYPEGLERILRQTTERFKDIPIVITENGLADGTDRYRPELIRKWLHHLDRAKFGTGRKAPVDVRGYYHWTLTDNFEWEQGYAHQFGLIEVLFDQGLTRVPRPSASVYREQIQLRRGW